MANTKISYKGDNAYLVNDGTNYSIYTAANEIYLNKDMSNMFNNCNTLTLNLNKFNVNYSKIENMRFAFYRCENIIGSPFCGENVTNMRSTYYNCFKLMVVLYVVEMLLI